jgi:glycerol-3-phosphate acyltransferase PlsY
MLNLILGIIIAYLIGAIPTSYIFGRILKGVDLRQHGSGNLGATNVYRVVGRLPGSAVLLIDISKGLLAVTIIPALFQLDETGSLLLGLSAVCGHIWTVYLKFKGGKGVATALGVLLGLKPPLVLVAVVVWALTVLITRYVSLGSILASITIPIVVAFYGNWGLEYAIFTIVLCIILVLRHHPNIKRLIKGEEKRLW